MIYIAIVEDDDHDKTRLKKCLKKYEQEMRQRFEIMEFSDGEDITTDYTAKYDLILMDIEMTFMNGMSAAQRIREMDPDVQLIFITNMPQYAIQGYKVNGDVLTMSRGRRNAFLDALNVHMNGERK